MNIFHRIVINKPQKWLIEAAESIGLDYSELCHEVTRYFFEHVTRRHGEGGLAVTEKDCTKIPAIVKTPDLAVIGATRGNKIFNAYVKRMDGETYLYFDEVMNSKRNKALRGSTLYKIKKQLDMGGFIGIITMNGKSDVSGAKKVIAAGGHPGEEA